MKALLAALLMAASMTCAHGQMSRESFGPDITESSNYWHFNHDTGVTGQIAQIVFGLIFWTVIGNTALLLVIASYESGREGKLAEKIDADCPREEQKLPISPMGWYRKVFAFRFSVTAAFIIEAIRFGGRWPSLLLLGLAWGWWRALSPERGWLKRFR